MSHETLREQVVDLALGALDPREAREVEAHAAGCAECGRALAGLRATRSAMAALPPLPAPERGEAVLLAAARLAAEAAAERRPRLLPRWLWAATFGAATAAAALLVTLQLSGAPTASRFDEGRDALATRSPAPAPAATPAMAPPTAPAAAEAAASAPPPGPLLREEAKAKLADAQKAIPAPPPAMGPAPAPLGGAGGRGAIGVDGAAVAKEEAPPADQFAGAPRAAPPARARKAAEGERRQEPVATLQAAPAGVAEVASAEAAVRRDANLAEAKAARPRPPAPPPAQQGPPSYGFVAPAASRAAAACPGERSRSLERDPAGRLLRRVRAGALGGREYRAEERYGPDGRLAGATVLLDGREVALRAGDPEPIPGLRLAATAAEAEAAPPACGP